MRKSNRFLDIIIVTTFLISISIPAILTTSMNSSQTEKRKLHPFPYIRWNKESIIAFPKAFEQFFDDHFGFREPLVRLYSMLHLQLGSSPSPKVVVGKKGWFFYTGRNEKGQTIDGNPIGDYQKNDPFSKKELEQWKEHLEFKYYSLKAQGIDYLFVIAPNKSTIYGEYMPSRFKWTDGKSRYDQLIDCMKNSEVPIVDLRPILLNNKNNSRFLLYNKTGTHWNSFGASIAQYAIAEKLAQIFPEIVPVQYSADQFILKPDRADMGLILMMNLTEHWDSKSPVLVENNIGYAQNKLDDTPYFKTNRVDAFFYTTSPDPIIGKHALVFRDSFFQQLQPYISRYFKKATYIWTFPDFIQMERFIKDIPCDLVIEERVERYLHIPPLSQVESNYYQTGIKKYFQQGNKLFNLSDYTENILFRSANQIEPNQYGKGYKILATGNDAYFELPELNISPNDQLVFQVELTAPNETEFQLFYCTTAKKYFSEKNSYRIKLRKGLNEFYVHIYGQHLTGSVRIDPGRLPGEYWLKKLEIRKLSSKL